MYRDNPFHTWKLREIINEICTIRRVIDKISDDAYLRDDKFIELQQAILIKMHWETVPEELSYLFRVDVMKQIDYNPYIVYEEFCSLANAIESGTVKVTKDYFTFKRVLVDICRCGYLVLAFLSGSLAAKQRMDEAGILVCCIIVVFFIRWWIERHEWD